MSYAERILHTSDGDDVLLVRVEPTIRIGRVFNPSLTWEAVSGYDGLFRTSISPVLHGITWGITRVSVGRMEYPSVSGIWECFNTNKTWVSHDGYLYLNPKDGRDLDTYIVNASMQVCYASKSKRDFEQPYLDYLIDDPSNGTVTLSVADALFGIASFNAGRLVLKNAQKEFYNAVFDFNWITAIVTFLHSVDLPGNPAPLEDYEPFKTAMITTVEDIDDNAVTFTLSQPLKLSKGRVHTVTTSTSSANGDPPNQVAAPNADPSVVGANPPVVIGAIPKGNTLADKWRMAYDTNCIDVGTAIKKSTKRANCKYKVMANFYDPQAEHTHGANDVDSVLVKNTAGVIAEIKGANWTQLENFTGVRFINYGVDPYHDEVRLVPTSIKDSSAGKFTGSSGGLIKKALHLIDFELTLSGVKRSQIDVAAFTEIGNTKPDEFGNPVDGVFDTSLVPWWDDHRVHVQRKGDFAQVIQLVLYGINAAMVFGYDGKYTLVQLTDVIADDCVVIKEPYIVDWKQGLTGTDKAGQLVIQYGYNQRANGGTSQAYKQRRSDRKTTIGGKECDVFIAPSLGWSDSDNVITTGLTTTAKADLAANYLYRRLASGIWLTYVTVSSNICGKLLPGQNLLLNKEGAVDGPYVDEPMRVLSVTPNVLTRSAVLVLMPIRPPVVIPFDPEDLGV